MSKSDLTKMRLNKNIIELMSSFGYNGISIRKITKMSNIKESTFYYYFKNKKSIFDIVINNILEKLNKNLNFIKVSNGYLFLQNSIITVFKIFKDINFLKLWKILNIEIYNSDVFIKNKFLSAKIFIKRYFKEVILYLKNNHFIKDFDDDIIVDDLFNNVLSILNEYMELKLEDKNTFNTEEKLFKYIGYFWEKIKK